MSEPTLIKELISIPERGHQGDFVLRLSEGLARASNRHAGDADASRPDAELHLDIRGARRDAEQRLDPGVMITAEIRTSQNTQRLA